MILCLELRERYRRGCLKRRGRGGVGVLEFFLVFEGAQQNWETHLFFHLPVSLQGVGRREGNQNVGEVCVVLKLFSVEEISPADIQTGCRNRSRAPSSAFACQESGRSSNPMSNVFRVEIWRF